MIKICRAHCRAIAAGMILLGWLPSATRGSSIIELIGADPYIFPVAPQPTVFFAPDPAHSLVEPLTVQDFSLKFDAASSIDITPLGSPYTLYSIDLLAELNADLQSGAHVGGTSSANAELRIDPPVSVVQGLLAPLSLDNMLLTFPGAGGYPSFMLRTPSGSPATGELLMTTDGNRISSFFDVFTELSVDGGQNWIPASGPMHTVAIPEPTTLSLAAVGMLMIALAAVRRSRSG